MGLAEAMRARATVTKDALQNMLEVPVEDVKAEDGSLLNSGHRRTSFIPFRCLPAHMLHNDEDYCQESCMHVTLNEVERHGYGKSIDITALKVGRTTIVICYWRVP